MTPERCTDVTLLNAQGMSWKAIGRRLEAMAPLLWSEDYDTVLAEEREGLARIGVLQKSVELKEAAPASTYTMRGCRKKHPGRAVAYAQRYIKQADAAAATASA